MAFDKHDILERTQVLLKQLFNRITYSQEIFEDDIWNIRLSKKPRQRIRYTTQKKVFSLSIKDKDDIYKYLFLISMAAMLVVMLTLSKGAGISTREMEQHLYSEMVYNHFHHIGDVQAYRSHPFASTQAQYIDLIVYSFCHTLHISDIFTIRHLLSALFGWLLILYLSVLILRAFNWRAAFFTAFFLLISPRFFGYSLSNLVDVTFAFGFIFAITQIYYFCRELPVIRIYRCAKIMLGIFLALSTYNAGFVLLHFLCIFTLLNFLLYNPFRKFFTKEYLKSLGFLSLLLIGTTVFVYFVHGLATLFLVKSAVAPRNAIELLTYNIPTALNQLFEGKIIGPDNFPHRYLGTYLFITTPTIVLIGFLLFFIFFKSAAKSLKFYSIFIFLYSFLYCIHKVKSSYMNPDTMWAIHYFIYPLFMLIAASGVECALRSINDKYTNFVVMCIIGLLSVMPIRHIAFNHPTTSIYFNEISGGIHNAYAKYELDYNDDVNKTACEWLSQYIYREDIGKRAPQSVIRVATNGNAACKLFFEKDAPFIQVAFVPYNAQDTTWDYYLSFCNDVPAAQLRNGTWPPDSVFHTLNIETKPLVAFYKNPYRENKLAAMDSLRDLEQAHLDSLSAVFLQ